MTVSKKFVSGGDLALPLEELAQPSHLLLEPHVRGGALLVAVVGSYAVFRDLMHVLGAYLDFKRHPALAHDGSVEGLVHVVLVVGDVIVELARYGTPQVVHRAQGVVAVALGIHEDAEGIEVVDVGAGLLLGLVLVDFSGNAVDVLGTASHLGFDVGLLQGRG